MKYLAYLDRVFGDYRFSYEAIKYNNIENSWLIDVFWYISNFLWSEITQYIFLWFIFFIGGICAWILSSKFVKNKSLRFLFVLFWISTPWLYSRGMRWQVRNMLSYMLLPLIVYVWWIYYDKNEDNQIFTKPNMILLLKIILVSALISITNIRYVPIVWPRFLIIMILKDIKSNWLKSWSFSISRFINISTKIWLYIIGLWLTSLYWIIPFYIHTWDLQLTIQDFEYFSPKWDRYKIIWQLITMSWQADENWIMLYPAYLSKINNLTSAILLLIIFIYSITKIKISWFYKILIWFAVFAILFWSGISLPLLWYINTFIIKHIPWFNFYREPGKWLVWVPLLYGIFIRTWLDHVKNITKITQHIKTIWIILLSIIIWNNIYFYLYNWFHFDRYISYPVGWYEARDRLSSNQLWDRWSTISLPRHRYMRCDFTNDKIIQNPSGVFFGPDVIYGDNMEGWGIYTNINNELGLFFEWWYDEPRYWYDNPDWFLYKLREMWISRIIWLENNCAKWDNMIDFIDKYDEAWLWFYKVFENKSIRIYDIDD